jgi:hypothetical protein
MCGGDEKVDRLECGAAFGERIIARASSFLTMKDDEDDSSIIFSSPSLRCRITHPLSTAELCNVKSLLTTCSSSSSSDDTSSSSSTTKGGKVAVLTGKRVMIPFTKHAYFEGMLSPPTITVSQNNEKEQEEEVVHVVVNQQQRGAAIMKAMSCSQALEILCNMYGNDSSSSSSKQQHDDKEEENDSIAISSNRTTTISTTTPPDGDDGDDDDDEQQLPLMEIREVCNDNGTILTTQVINISNAIQQLENINAATTTASSDDDSKKDHETLTLLAKALIEMIMAVVAVAAEAEEAEGEEEEEEETNCNDDISSASTTQHTTISRSSVDARAARMSWSMNVVNLAMGTPVVLLAMIEYRASHLRSEG